MYAAKFQRLFSRIITLFATIFLFSFFVHAQNNALDFDGSNDVVTTSDFFEFRSDYTVEAWINTSATTGMIVSKWDAGDGNSTFSLQLSSGRPWASNNEAPFSFISTQTINDGNWHHIAVTYDLSATTITMYVDGLEDISNTSAGVNGTQNNFDIAIGAEADGGTPLDGTIDEVRIWNDVRTEEELALNMNHELSGAESGLIAYYNFNQGTADGSNGAFTSLPDESTNSNTGTLSNFSLSGSSSNYITGFPGTNNALDFDGSNDHAIINNDAELQLTSGTVEAWVRSSNNTTGFRAILTKRLAYSMFVASSTDAEFGAFDWTTSTYTSSGQNILDGNWHHVAFAFDNGVVNGSQLYVDGVAAGSPFMFSISGQTENLALGTGNGSGGFQFLLGELDEVRVWNTVRTCSDILSTKDVELTGSESNLIAYYNFNHGTAGGTNTGLTTLPDLSGNNNDGTLTNLALSGAASNWVDGSGNSVSGNTPAAQPEINVQGNNNDIVDGSTTIDATINTDFGTQTSSNAIVYTIQNTGTATLNISSITSTGTNSSDFVVSGSPSTVAASGSETFTVTFGPLATGTRNATITINSDDCDEAAYDFAVQGVGDKNHALDFDGTNDFVSIADDNSLDFTSTFTLEAWINLTSTTGSRAIISKYFSGTSGETSYRLQVLDGNIRFQVNNSGATTVSSIDQSVGSVSASTWHHIAAVANGSGNILIYMDGALVGTGSYDNTVYVGTRDVLIGKARIEDGASITDGVIDEVRIWNIARSCSEILATKDIELTGSESGLIAYYNFNQNEAGGTNTGQTTLDDLTSNNNDGTLTNFALMGSTSNWVGGSGNNVSNSTTPVDQPEINVQGNSNDIADGSTAINATINTDFGTQTASNAIIYTIQNTGSGTLNISSITSTGTNSGDFVVSGAPTTVAASGSETFTVTFTPGGSGNRTATITINSDDCDEAAYDFAVQGSGPAPGGIAADLQLWLKGGFGFTASQWSDQSGNGNHAVQGTASAQPSNASSQINFNGAADFDGSDYLTLTNNASTMGLNNSDYELFFVANSSTTDVQFLISSVTQERYEMHINGDAGHRFIPANATNFSDIGSTGDYSDGIYRIFGGTLQSSGASAASHINGLFTTDIETPGLQTSETGVITIGRREATGTFHWTGQMGEVLIYGDAMTVTQRQQVFTYLAVRHGITLDQTSATNYLAGDGGIVWNATTNAAYNDDIAGLARDDASELDQRQSSSLNSSAIIQLANGQHVAPSTYSVDDSWLIWGHDGGATTIGTDNIDNSNATTSNRMTRVWRVQETGTVGSVQIRFSNALATGTVSIVVHTSDPTFPADGNRRVVEMTDDGTHYQGEIDLVDGEYFSFANANYATLTSQFVVINEVITDPQQDWGASNFFNPSPGGTGDADDEWIELYITTDDLDMSSWTIEMNDGTDETGSLLAGGAFNQSNYRSLTGGSLSKTKSGDYLILGDPASGMMNSTGGLTIILKDGSGGTIDQVTIATGSGTGFSGSATGTTDESVARIPNGADTDVDATDFVKTLASLGGTSSPSGTVVINEVVTDPFTDWSTSSFDGTFGAGTVSDVDEWIELYIGTSGLNLTGWTMEISDSSPESGSIASGGFFATVNYISSGSGTFINTEAGDYLILGNPSGATNNTGLTIILRDAGNIIIDQVTIGGGSGEAPSGANSAFNSEAIARYPNATDTGTDDADFIQTRPTLGATNSPTGTVLINEIVTDPQQDWSTNDFNGTIAGGPISEVDEWIELYIGTAGINLTNWTIELTDGSNITGNLTSSGAFDVSNYTSSGSGNFFNTAVGDYLVLGNPDGTGSMEDDIVITLKDASGATVDEIELGDDVASDGAGDGAPDGSANGGLATGIADEAIARIPNGMDTGNDVNDFAAVPASLGALNSTAQLPGVGNGLIFDGVDDYVNVASPFTGYTNEITIEAWINLNTLTSAEAVMAQSTANSDNASTNVWLLGNIGTSNGSLTFFVWDGSTVRNATSTTDFRGTGWHHVVGVSDATSTRLYVDGILESSGAAISSGIQSNASAVIHIGKDARYASGRFLDGTIDEVRIWNSARTQEQILEGMQSLEGPGSSGIQTYYRFDQSSGTTLNDLTSNNRDGSLTNMAGTEWAVAGWDIFAQNQAIFQSGGMDLSTGTSGELTMTDVSFLNDDNDLLLAGHDNSNFSEVTTDLPSGTLLTARYDRTWNLTKNDASGTSNGSVRLGFDLGNTPDVTYTYYLLERTGTSGNFAIIPVPGVNPNGNSIEFTVDASAIDNGSYYTLGRSDAGVGNALNLDGSNDYIDLGDLTLTSGSIEMWLNPDALPANQRIYSQLSGASTQQGALGINPQNDGNDYDIYIWDGSAWLKLVDLSADWSTEWHHLALVHSGGSTTAFWDGVQQQTQTANFDFNGIDFGLGSNFLGSFGTTWNGNFDEVRIWSDARTQQEILDNMFANLTGDEANLARYYRFNQGIGDSNTRLPDLSANGNGGTLTNFNNLGSATTSSNYVASTRTGVTTSVIISNGGNLTATDGELTLTSTQTAGDFLQDANDFIRWNNDGGAFTETTADIPTGTLVTNRYTITWQLDKNDAVGTVNGNVTFTFDLGAVPDPDYTYFLLSRSGTSGAFSIVEALGSSPSGNNMSFAVDAGEVTDNNYFTLGRTDSGAGNTLNFDGTNDVVDLGGQLINASSLTVEAWVNGSSFTNSGRFNRIVALNYDTYTSDNPFALFVNASGQIGYVFGTGDANNDAQVPLSFSPTLSTNTWYHVALTFNGSIKSLYVDGILQGTVTNSGTFTNINAEPLLIGDFDNATSDNGEWEGQMDEVRIWSDVRTEQEIRDNMNRKLDVANESNLVGYYQFNTGIADGTNTGTDILTDRSGNNNRGTLTNFGLSGAASNWVASTAAVADQTLVTSLQGAGNALDFDGTNDYVSIPDNDVLSFGNGTSDSPFSVEFWMSLDFQGTGTFISKRVGGEDEWEIIMNGSQLVVFLRDDSTTGFISASTPGLSIGQWYHVTVVYDGSGSHTGIQIYLDGIPSIFNAHTSGSYTAMENGTSPVEIGITNNTGTPLDGKMDELRIWNKALTMAEVQAQMFESLTGSETGLVSYYTFNESTGTTLDDNSANSNTGTLINMDDTDWVNASDREPFKTNGPGNLNSGSTWVGGATPGASQTLYVQHDLTVDADLTVDDFNLTSGNTLTLGAGQILTVTGNLVNNGTIAGDGKIQFTSGTPMISGGTFSNLEMNGGSPMLCGNMIMTGTLTLTSGNLQLENYNLTLNSGATISGGSSTSYIQTFNLNSSGGAIEMEIGSSDGAVTYPLGTNTNYTPISFTNLGTTASFAIRTFDGIYAYSNSGAAFTSNVINKTWDVSATGSGFNVTLNIQWNTADEASGFDRSNMYISTNDGTGWVERSGPLSATEVSSGIYQASASGISSFSGVGGGGDVITPVTLLDFYALQVEDGIELVWHTATEIDNDKFIVERSIDGFEFKPIDEVSGNGDSDDIIEYRYMDMDSEIGINYYRLKQVDFNGDFEYSPIVIAETEIEEHDLVVYPNPFTDRLYIGLKQADVLANIKITGINGQVILQETVISNNRFIQFENLQAPPGIYILEIQQGDEVIRMRIVNE